MHLYDNNIIYKVLLKLENVPNIHLIVSRPFAVDDIVFDGTGKQCRFLAHHGNLLSEPVWIQLFHVTVT